ncbi:MAG: acyltransferase [Bradyrhizobium sp.]|uniref:acyltransferase family protein n=1 Tax=Bradyrhizobium sp. TaxID=376 RepID=UPI0025BEA3A8|nr:acyltransferase family protein [Bradyrhizobium sp.]MBI5260632.1 acyltransferase [Bradyrhizobium sp.]
MTSFRPEIAGLRALAVLSVLFFHLKLAGFQGGFIGVDVFFVISGYLISRNILREAEADGFSFAQFYLRRTRRIYPALIVTVLVTYIAGALWCAPLMFKGVAKEGTHALLSIANIQYWRESHQYFAANSNELALLHCWSLSLEEQFYLGWPIFIVFARKINRAWEAILVATALSIIGAVIASRTDSSAAFYLTPFRIYEFGCGALVLFAERFRVGGLAAEGLSLAGICGIVASAMMFRPDMPHLELAMLVPCLAAAGTILAGSQTLVSRLITNPVFMGIGAISYSLYLCHWPIIYFARFIFGELAESLLATMLLLLVMFAVAALMYFFVERAFILVGPPAAGRGRRTAVAFLSVILGLASVTHYTLVSGGLTWRMPADRQELVRLQEFPSESDVIPMSGPLALNLVGDSHAVQYQAGLSGLMQRLGLGMEILASPGCPVLHGVLLKEPFRKKQCEAMRDRSFARIASNRLPIVYVLYWSSYDDAKIDLQGESGPQFGPLDGKGTYTKLTRALEMTLERFAAGGRRVLVIGAQVDANCSFNWSRLYQGPLPHAPVAPCPPGSKKTAELAGARMNAFLNGIESRWPENVTLFRPVDHFCDDECPTMNDGLWLYHDGTHFSVAGSHYMVGRAEPELIRFLAPERQALSRP